MTKCTRHRERVSASQKTHHPILITGLLSTALSFLVVNEATLGNAPAESERPAPRRVVKRVPKRPGGPTEMLFPFNGKQNRCSTKWRRGWCPPFGAVEINNGAGSFRAGFVSFQTKKKYVFNFLSVDRRAATSSKRKWTRRKRSPNRRAVRVWRSFFSLAPQLDSTLPPLNAFDRV